jgi:hypothetical protein
VLPRLSAAQLDYFDSSFLAAFLCFFFFFIFAMAVVLRLIVERSAGLNWTFSPLGTSPPAENDDGIEGVGAQLKSQNSCYISVA